MSVNRPTNVKQKEADVNQKLQMYGIYSGMSLLREALCLLTWRLFSSLAVWNAETGRGGVASSNIIH